MTHGLASGEGLIWEVHDPIEETKPIRKGGRHTGEYETIIANQGEADKRLLIIRGRIRKRPESDGKGRQHAFAYYSLCLRLREPQKHG